MDIYNIVGPPTSIKQRCNSALRYDVVLQVFRDDEIVMTKDYLSMIPPPMCPKPDMTWKNEDWMKTYAALTRLSMFIDLQKAKNEGYNHFSDEQSECNELKRKLEFMFREHDGASEES